jgi:transcriptional regulator with XRE-family HTH domain
MDVKVLIGLRIKEIRTKQNLSQEDLALITGIDRTYMNSVERGKRNVSIINLEKIASGLNQSLYEFFDSDSFKRGK